MTRTDDSLVPDYQRRLRLDGRRFVIAGAGQGMGRQAAHALAQCGARVVCVDRDGDLAHEIAAEVGGVPCTGDMTNDNDVQAVFDAAAHALGGLDGVVDIIGMARWSSLLDCSDEDWDFQQDMNLRHAFYVIRHAGRLLREHGGSLVFVASVSGLTGAASHGPYGAAKAGLMALVKTAAIELGPYGVRVNAVAPGPIGTPRLYAMLTEDGLAANRANVPLGRMGEPADIASVLLFLASDLAGFVSGHTIVADGGVDAKFPYPEPDFAAG